MASRSLRLLIGTAMIAASGCVQQPAKVGSSAPRTNPTTASSSMQTLDMARDEGYRPVVVNGKALFCRREIPTGSTLPVTSCVDAVQLKFQVLREQQERQRLYEQAPGSGQPAEPPG
jgi:hypothetical protein